MRERPEQCSSSGISIKEKLIMGFLFNFGILFLAALMGLFLRLSHIRDTVAMLICSLTIPLSWNIEVIISYGLSLPIFDVSLPAAIFFSVGSGLVGYIIGNLIIKYKNDDADQQVPAKLMTRKALIGVLIILTLTTSYIAIMGEYLPDF